MKTRPSIFSRPSRADDWPATVVRDHGFLLLLCRFIPSTATGGLSSAAGNGRVPAVTPHWPTAVYPSSKLLFHSSSCRDPKRHASYNNTFQRKDKERTARGRDRQRGPCRTGRCSRYG